MFFEFGIPTIKCIRPKTREPFTVVRGEMSIGVHSDNWHLKIGSHSILSSDIISDANLAKVAKEFLIGIPVPRICFDESGVLELQFDRSILLRIESNAYPPDAGESYDELSINLGASGFRFNYKHGFSVAYEG